MVALLGSPISNGRCEFHHAKIGHIGRILVVVFNVRHVGTQDSIVVFRHVKHFDEFDVKVVGKVHVRIRLHTKILHVDGLKIEVCGFFSVHVIPIDLMLQPSRRTNYFLEFVHSKRISPSIS